MSIVRSIFYTIDGVIYWLVEKAYTLFLEIGSFEIDSLGEVVTGFYERMQSLAAIVMAFYVMFMLVKWFAEPEQVTKTGGKFITNIVVSVSLLLLINPIFSLLQDIQTEIIAGDTINRIILGDGNRSEGSYTDEDGEDIDGVARSLSRSMFGVFVRADSSDLSGKCSNLYAGIFEDKDEAGTGEFEGTGCLNKKSGSEYVVNYRFGLSTLVGGYMAYIMIMFCIDLGLRIVKMLFLQMIAPIPIISYITGSSAFNNWINEVVSTYISIFVRMALFSFMGVLIDALMVNVESAGFFSWVTVFVVLGLMLFAKQAPGLISKMLGLKGGTGLDISGKSQLAALTGAAMAAPKAVGAVASGAKKVAGGVGKVYNTGAGAARGASTVAHGAAGAARGAWNGARNGSGASRVTGAIGGAVTGGAQGAAASMVKHRGDKAADGKFGESMSSFGQTLMGNLAAGNSIGSSISNANAARSGVRQAAAAQTMSNYAAPTQAVSTPRTFNYDSNTGNMKEANNSFKVNPASGNNTSTNNTGNNLPK